MRWLLENHQIYESVAPEKSIALENHFISGIGCHPEGPRFQSLLRNSLVQHGSGTNSASVAERRYTLAQRFSAGKAKSGKNRVRFSGRHKFRNRLFTSGTRVLLCAQAPFFKLSHYRQLLRIAFAQNSDRKAITKLAVVIIQLR
jgi:hypothetical protein